MTWTFDDLVTQALDLVDGAACRLPEDQHQAFYRKLANTLNVAATALELAAEGVSTEEFNRRLIEAARVRPTPHA